MNKKSTKALASATLMSLVLTTALTAGPVKAAATSATRVGGSDRYETAANVATKNWTTSDNVVLVSGQGYADAVSASALAKQLNAPILLTTPGTLSSATQAALTKLQAKNIYVVGGNASVSQSIRDTLKKSYKLTELGGATRYETNVAVANELVNKLGVKKDNVLVVGGTGFSDALSVAPIASAKGEILLLANNNQSDTQGAIDFAKGSNVTVVGTSNVINDSIKNAFGTSATRVTGGADRFETNLNVLANFKSDLKADKLYVANASGNGYADALVASAIAGKTASPLVLVDTDSSAATTNALAYIDKEATSGTDVEVFGGTGVVSDALLNKIGHTTPNTDPEVQSISANGLRQVKVVFNQAVDSDTAEDLTNYTVDGADLTEQDKNDATKAYDKAVLQDDDKTLLITLKDDQKQSAKVDVKVKKGILSKDKSQTVPELTQTVTFTDTTAPTVEDPSARGNKKLTVKFSEPINVGTKSNATDVYSKFKINDKNISGFGLDSTLTEAKDAAFDGKNYWTNEVDFYFSTALPTGNNTLKVTEGDKDLLADASEYPVQDTTKNFNVDTLTTAPKITSITAEDNGKVYINFDRPMEKKSAQNTSYYQINDRKSAVNNAELKKDDTQIKLSVSDLNKNTNKVYIKNNVKDAYGNKVPDDTYEEVKLTEDTTKPTVNSITALNDTTIRVRYSKDVDASFARSISNYKLQDNSGTDITSEIKEITIPGGTNKDTTASVFDIKLGTDTSVTPAKQYKLTDSKYTLTIQNVRDTASTPNVMDKVEQTIDGSADVNAEVTGVYGVKGNDKKITLTFNKEMDSSTLNNTANYKYENASGDTKVLPSTSKLSVSTDNKSVTIELPDAYTYADGTGKSNDNQVTKVYAVGVKDRDGNELQVGSQGGAIKTATSENTTTIKAKSIKTSYDGDDLKVDVDFTNPIDSDTLKPEDFFFGTVKANSASVNGSKVTLTFNSDNDGTTQNTPINNIKKQGLSAKISLAPTVSTKDVMGVPITVGPAEVTPYFYDAAPKTIVTTDNGKLNWTANIGGTEDTVNVVFDTPINANSVKTGDFNFAINGTTLTPDKAAVSTADKNTVVFTFNTDTKVGNGNQTVEKLFTSTSTMTVTPNTDAKSISTEKDGNGDYAYYTPSNDDMKGIKIVVTTANASADLQAAQTKAASYKAADWTADSYKALTDAVTAANALPTNATDTDKEAKAQAINNAISKLVAPTPDPTKPTATVEQAGTLVFGKVVVVVSLQSGADATKYNVTVDKTALTYDASTGKYTGVINEVYPDAATAKADLQAKTVVTAK